VLAGVLALGWVGNSVSNSLEATQANTRASLEREIAYERETMELLIRQEKEQVKALAKEFHEHVKHDLRLWQDVASESSATGQRFVEVETQFSDLERRIRDLEGWQTVWHSTVPATDATQDQKIAALEATVFGQEIGERRVKDPTP